MSNLQLKLARTYIVITLTLTCTSALVNCTGLCKNSKFIVMKHWDGLLFYLKNEIRCLSSVSSLQLLGCICLEVAINEA